MKFIFKSNVGGRIPNEMCNESFLRFKKEGKSFELNWAFIGKDTILELLGKRPGEIAGIKIIPGLDSQNKPQIMLSSVTKEGDVITSYDFSQICPPFCGQDLIENLNENRGRIRHPVSEVNAV